MVCSPRDGSHCWNEEEKTDTTMFVTRRTEQTKIDESSREVAGCGNLHLLSPPLSSPPFSSILFGPLLLPPDIAGCPALASPLGDIHQGDG